MSENLQRPAGAPDVRTLSEREIQHRLYGGYLGRRSGHAASRAVPTHTSGSRPGAAEPPQWTGSEILTGELERLRSELITLRQEKEKLATTLQQMGAPAREFVRVEEVHRAPVRTGAGWLGKLAAVAVLLGAGGYGISGRILQASPAAGDPTPFTVQAAVYDTLVPAQLAVQFLGEMSYGAFLVPVTRKDGRVRYRICVGSYVTKDEADLERLRLLGDPRFGYFKDAFVRVR